MHVVVLDLFSKKPFQSLHRLREILASQPKAEVVVRVVVDRAGEQKHPRLCDEVIAEGLDPPLEEFGEAHRAGMRTVPGEERRVTGKEVVNDRKVGLDDAKVAVHEGLAVTQCEFGEEFAWGGITDGGVVLH